MNCRRKGSRPPHLQVCCLTEHSDKLEFAFLHTRRPLAENEVKSTNAGPNAVKWHCNSNFAAVHEGDILQRMPLVQHGR